MRPAPIRTRRTDRGSISAGSLTHSTPRAIQTARISSRWWPRTRGTTSGRELSTSRSRTARRRCLRAPRPACSRRFGSRTEIRVRRGMALGGSDEITLEELQLAARNHGMPLEALRYPLTPVGLHYLLTHYDIPALDPAAWRLEVGGRVEHPMLLALDELRAMPAITAAGTLECAGNGRPLLEPRPASQPWLLEAVGTGEWTGVALSRILETAGV